jgi:hypothetical protein
MTKEIDSERERERWGENRKRGKDRKRESDRDNCEKDIERVQLS